jgi:RNA polymerase subunit RPABC4/transcription elongation factor Spt4
MPNDVEELIACSILMLLLHTPVAGGLLALLGSPPSRVAALTGLAFVGVAFVIIMVAAVLETGFPDEEWAVTWSAVGGYGLLAAFALIGLGNARRPWLQAMGALPALAAMALALLEVWGRGNVEKLAIWTGALAVLVALVVLTKQPKLRGAQVVVRLGTWAAAFAAMLLIDLLVLYELSDPDAYLWRFVAAAVILTGCGSLAILIFVPLNRRRSDEHVATMDAEVRLVCPVCGSRQSISLGDGQCSSCHLRFRIQIEEPRCQECDYLLLRVTSDVCPECGTPIEGAKDRGG